MSICGPPAACVGRKVTQVALGSDVGATDDQLMLMLGAAGLGGIPIPTFFGLEFGFFMTKGAPIDIEEDGGEGLDPNEGGDGSAGGSEKRSTDVCFASP